MGAPTPGLCTLQSSIRANLEGGDGCEDIPNLHNSTNPNRHICVSALRVPSRRLLLTVLTAATAKAVQVRPAWMLFAFTIIRQVYLGLCLTWLGELGRAVVSWDGRRLLTSMMVNQVSYNPRNCWPVHLKPQVDELTSSWIVRLALAHGHSAQAFSHLVLKRNIWKMDFDITSDEIALEIIAHRTNTPIQRARQTTLGAYEGWLFTSLSTNGVQKWFLTRNQNPRFTREVRKVNTSGINSCTKGYGLQFCPLCLTEDREPYFRRIWRLAHIVLCTKHRVPLMNKCAKCGESINFHLTPRNLHELKHPFLITQCFSCFSDLRDSAVEQSRTHIDVKEIEFQRYLLDGLMRGSISLPHHGQIYSHLFFDGLYQILSGLIVGRRGKNLRGALKSYFNLRIFSEEHLSQNLPIRRLDITERRGLLEASRLLLENWPDRFVMFSKSHKVSIKNLVLKKSETPYWLFKVIQEHLIPSKYVHVVTDQEIQSVIGYLKGRGIEPTYTNLCKYIPKNAAYAFLSKSNFIWQAVKQKCPCCQIEAVQFRSGLDNAGKRLYQCQACNCLHLYNPAPSVYPRAVRERAIKLRQAGNKPMKIAAMLSVHHGTIRRWWRDYKSTICI